MPDSTSSPFEMQARRMSRQTGGRTPPVGATPTIAVVGAWGSASATRATIGIPS